MRSQGWVRSFLLAGLVAAALGTVLASAQLSGPPAPAAALTSSDVPLVAGGGLDVVPPAVLGGDNIPDIIISPGGGGTPTRVVSGATGVELGAGFPFGPGFGGRVSMAAGDLTSDGVPDLVAAMGSNGGLVTLLNGATIASLGGGYPFGPGFTGGVSVAVGDLDGDGHNDIVTAQASGGGLVSVFNGINYAPIFSLAPFGPGYSGGVNLAVGDVDGDGRTEVIAGQANGGVVSIIGGVSHTVTVSGVPFGVNGVFVAAGDITNDGRAEVIVAPGVGNGPVLVFDIATLSVVRSFVPYPGGFGGGVRIAASDLTGDGAVEIMTVPGPGIAPVLQVYDGVTGALVTSQPALAPSFLAGAFVTAPASSGIRFTSPTSTRFTVGTAGDFDIVAVGAPAVTSVTLTGTLPAGVTFTDEGNGRAALAGTPAPGAGGTYALTITAANGVSAPATQAFTLTVDEVATITSAATTTFNIGTAGSFSITTTGFPRPTISVTGALPTGLTFTDNGNGTATIAGTAAAGTGGSYPLTITASNGVGTAATQGFTLIAQDAPIFTSANAVAFDAGAAGSFTVTTTATPPTTSITITAGALPAGVTLTDNGNGTATIAGTPGASTGGAYALTLTASNGIASTNQAFTLTVRQAPAITSANTTTFAQGAPGTFTITTTGYPRPTIVLTGALPSGVTFTDNGNGTATIAGTPAPGTGGSYALNLNASNGIGSAATQPFTLAVTAAPVITSAATTTFVAGTPGTFTVTTTGGPTPTLSVSGALPAGVTFTPNGNGTATIAGTPAAGGVFPLVITATNGIGSPATQNFTLTVNQAPAFTSAASTSFTAGAPGTFSVTTSGVPAATLSRSGTLPSGVTFTPNSNGTGTLAGTPAAGSQGNYPLVFTAANGVGSPVTQNFMLTVACAVVTVSPPSGALPAASYGAAYSRTITATGGSGHTFALTAGALPAGLTFVSSGLLSGTPTQTGTFNFTVTATASGGCAGSASYSLSVSPVAADETFTNGVGNTQYVVGAGAPLTPAVVVSGSVLTNDAGAGALSAGPANIASTNGGQVAMAANGTFVYTPPIGFAGPSDTFTYTLTDGNGATDPAVVTIGMSGVVWYVNGAGGAGDGRSHAPFNSMAAASTAALAGQTIYVHAGSPAGTTTMKTGQLLQGAGEAFVLNSLIIPASSAPVLQGTIVLANNAAVRALNVNAGAAAAISAVALTGAETLTNVSISGGSTGLQLVNLGGTFTITGGAISGVSGDGVAINGGTGIITIGASVNATAIAARAVHVQNHTGGTISFTAPINDSATGVLLTGNTGSTIAFTGGLNVFTVSDDAFVATGGGTITATQNNTTIINTLQTGTGTALRVENTQIGAAGLTFRSISAGAGAPSAGAGIVLNNTGLAVGNGGLSVAGTGTAASGGHIHRKSGADGSLTQGVGISLVNTKNASFAFMQLNDFDNSAVTGYGVNGLSLANSVIDGVIGNAAAPLEGPFVFGTPNPGGVTGLIGAVTLSNTTMYGAVEHLIEIYNQSGALNLTMSGTAANNCEIADNSPTTGGDGLVVQTEGTATATINVARCRFRNARGRAVYVRAIDSSSVVSTFANTEVLRVSQGVDGLVFVNANSASLSTTVASSIIEEVTGTGILIGQEALNANTASLLQATITDNSIFLGGTAGRAIVARHSSALGQAAPARLLFRNNFVQSPGALEGVLVSTPDAGTTPHVDVTFDANHVDLLQDPPGPFGMRIQATASAAGTNICARAVGNLSHHPVITPPQPPGAGLTLQQANTTMFRLERGAAAITDPAVTVLAANQPALTEVSTTGTYVIVENNTCQVPTP
ncbi:MAG: putative Ig domain-containing protein [Acidobacteria bacterium]|nr:putative Ig domain-containing protein [Acidobacteriota bacterium]